MLYLSDRKISGHDLFVEKLVVDKSLKDPAFLKYVLAEYTEMEANTPIKRKANEVLAADKDHQEWLLNSFLLSISQHGYRKYRDLYLKWRDYGKPIQTRNAYPPLEDQSERARTTS